MRVCVLVCLSIFMLVGLLGCDQHDTTAVKSNLNAEAEGLVFDPKELDMGEVFEGEKTKAVLLIRNNSDSILQIAKIESSCGCTAAEPESWMLAAGEFTPLHIVVDTFGKLGDVRKSITLTDGQGRETTAWLTLHVKKSAHAMVTNRSIFDGECASCHFDAAQGKTTGKAIYDAVCVMCHGVDGAGGYAPKLRGQYHKETFIHLLANGTGTQHMPAFAKKKGGPLDDKQISALTEWMLSLDE